VSSVAQAGLGSPSSPADASRGRTRDEEEQIVREALALRAWALRALCSAGDGPRAAAPSCSPTGWSVFLAVERCALPLQQAGAFEVGRPAGAAGAGLIHQMMREWSRVRAARGQCEEIRLLARERGWRVVVLKGGRDALEPTGGVDLCDLDLLPSPDCLQAFCAGLAALGYRATGGVGAHRLPVYVRPGALPLEVHTTVPGLESGPDVWEAAAPRDGQDGLWDLRPADRLWHLVHHAVVQHIDRRGSLRDLYVTMQTLRSCPPGEIAEVERRCGADVFAEPLTAFLRMALEMCRGQVPEDPFRLSAAANYILALSPSPPPALHALRLIHDELYADVAPGRFHASPFRARAWIGLAQPSHRPQLRLIQEKAPWLSTWLRLAWMSARVVAALPRTRSVVRRARHACA
jgi:Uncharacterised nucleotidyltransferase